MTRPGTPRQVGETTAHAPATVSELLGLLEVALSSPAEARKYQYHIRRVPLPQWIDLLVELARLSARYPGGGQRCDAAKTDIRWLCGMLEFRVDDWSDVQLAEVRTTLAEARQAWAECPWSSNPQGVP
jgi:hypothetical protein